MDAVNTTDAGRLIFVLCSSHRARDGLRFALGRDLGTGWYSFSDGPERNYGVYEVTEVELPQALTCKGVRRFRPKRPETWRRCHKGDTFA